MYASAANPASVSPSHLLALDRRQLSMKDPLFLVHVDIVFRHHALGLRLASVSPEKVAPYNLHAEVAEILRLPNGNRGPIDDHNLRAALPSLYTDLTALNPFSTLFRRRVYRGMRLSIINSTFQTDVPFETVMDMLNRIPRPLVVRFVDCAKGITADLPLAMPILPSTPPMVPSPLVRRALPLPTTLPWVPWSSMFAIEFPTGRLGIIWAPSPSQQQLSTQIHALYEHPSGLRTLAERYNAMSDDFMHLRPGLSLAAINHHALVAISHDDVVDHLRRTPRPITLHFCLPDEELSEDATCPVVRLQTDATLQPECEPHAVVSAIKPTAAAAPSTLPPAPVPLTIHTTRTVAAIPAASSTATVASGAPSTSTTGGAGGTVVAGVAPTASRESLASAPTEPQVAPIVKLTPMGTPAPQKGKQKKVVDNPKLNKDRRYTWVQSTNVRFGPGAFGMKTQEYKGSVLPEFQVEVYEITSKGSLETINATMDTKVQLGMRLVSIDDQGLQHKSYDQVLGLLRAAGRPVTIAFADVLQSTVEDKEYDSYLESTKPVSWWGGGGATVKPLEYLVPIEIAFDAGPLGLETRDITEFNGDVPLNVEVNAIVQVLESGAFGPVTLYNWSHPSTLRLQKGMRIYKVNDKVMWASPYTEVLETIRKASRPVVVAFVDAQGIQCDDDDESELDVPQQQALFRNQLLQLDQIDTEKAIQDTNALNWGLEGLALTKEGRLAEVKSRKVGLAIQLEMDAMAALNQELTALAEEEMKMHAMIQELDALTAGTMENPLVVRSKRLEERSTKLQDRTKKLKADQKKLKARQSALTVEKDQVEALVAALPEEQISDERIEAGALFDVDIVGATKKEQLELFKRHFKELQKEYEQEDRRRKLVQREVAYMRRHIKSLSKAEKKTKKTAKVKSTETDSRISNLREKLKLINDQLATAAEKGNSEHANKLSKRRKQLTKQLKALKEDKESCRDGGTATKKKKSRKESKAVGSTYDAVTQTATSVHAKPLVPQSETTMLSSPSPQKLNFLLEGTLDKHPTISNETDIFTSGWKQFKKAYPRVCFITPRGTLAYYRQKGDSEPRGELNLVDRSLEITVNGCAFTLCTSTESTKFEARSSGECRKWVDAVKAANLHFVRQASQRKTMSK
ncbi:Aste57867_11769 [Aphanomyces stellatus]|uniref:Aste57867_11769 protein n=1 Tax=Aphanomyces stellatus TaxID=120398 RepID=A0A485KU97_9STRA|nr:hypothetical protein As57867_011724 [Aphanomyces stellatus]VFT88625.1 Aste57867_11769 [Aphanomyces stellatus]